MLLLNLLLQLPAAAGAAPAVVDVGRPMPAGTPVALIIATPGVPPPAYDPLVSALEGEGVDAWMLSVPVAQQQAEVIVATYIPAARAAVPAGPLALVGHGLGGTLAAQAALLQPPDALALLGTPLSAPGSALVTWWAQQPVPSGGLDLAQAAVTWQEQDALTLLVGTAPTLGRVSASWLLTLQTWVSEGQTVSLDPLACPTWVGVGLLDELAAPEAVRPYIGAHTFVRFGYLRLDLRPFDNAALLSEARPTTALARWVAQALE